MIQQRTTDPALDAKAGEQVVKVAIADDHPIVCQGLRRLFEEEPDLQIVATANSALQTLEIVKQHAPDLLILDVRMPDGDTVEVVRHLRKHHLAVKILVFTMADGQDLVAEMVSNGVEGYVLKGEESVVLLEAVRVILNGERYFSRSITKQLVNLLLEEKKSDGANELLTAREHQVLHLAVRGYTNQEMAHQLSVSVRTIETHRANMMRKLGLRNQIDLVRYAFQNGILSLEA